LFFLLLSFSAPRSNVQMQSETDYQMALFLMLGIASAFMVIGMVREWKQKEVLVHDLLRVAQLVVGVFLIFSSLFLLANTYNKYFLRYTQQMPSINNLAYTADFVDRVLSKGDYYWTGPYEPQEQFFVKNAKTPGKYPSLLPQFKESETLKKAFIDQFEKHPPTLIIYRHEASIFMTPADKFGDFFLDWLKGKYTTIEQEKGVVVKQSPSSFTIKGDLYIRNDKKNEVLQKLRNEGFIE
jgi:hypothetical protein